MLRSNVTGDCFTRRATMGRSPRVELLAALAFALALLVPGSGLSQSESLDSVDTGGSESLDSVDDGSSGTPDGGRLAESDSLDSADTGQSESLDSTEHGDGNALDSAPLATAGAPNNDDLVWQPTPCSELPEASVEMPESSNPTVWVALLNRTISEIGATRQQLDEVTAQYGQTLYQGTEVIQANRVPLGRQRDALRKQYSEQLCTMPAILDAANRAGIEPGVLRPYDRYAQD